MSTDKEYGDTKQSILDATLQDIYDAGHMEISMMGGGSVSGEVDRDSAAADHDLRDWYPDVAFSATHAGFPSPVAPQVGPLDTGYITFAGGVPVGGFSQLTLFQSGNFNFNGHFHVSGAPSYNVSFAVGVRSRLGVLYTFLKSGHLAGTFEPGSRDFDWSVQENRAVIHEDWRNIAIGSTWWWNAGANWDPLALLGTIKTIAETAGAVGQVVKLL